MKNYIELVIKIYCVVVWTPLTIIASIPLLLAMGLTYPFSYTLKKMMEDREQRKKEKEFLESVEKLRKCKIVVGGKSNEIMPF